jgi:hypothetical protein
MKTPAGNKAGEKTGKKNKPRPDTGLIYKHLQIVNGIPCFPQAGHGSEGLPVTPIFFWRIKNVWT